MLKTIAKAIQQAHLDYEELSSDWLWQGAEYFLTVGIAKQVKHQTEAQWVSIETPVESGYVSFLRGRRSKSMRAGGRFDIAVWNDDPLITDVIEVKSSVHHSTCRADFDRLASITKRTSSTSGWFAYYFSQEKASASKVDEWLRRRAKDLELLAEEVADEYGLSVVSDARVSEAEEFDGRFSAYLAMSIGFNRS